MLTATRSRSLLLVVLTVAVTLVGIACVQLVRARPAYLDYGSKLAKAERIELAPWKIDPSWVISGNPVIRGNVFDHATDHPSLSGIWECTGPAKFTWHYGTDEVIYILGGSVDIEYLGKKFRLTAGERTHFAAGTTATWTVPERVTKTYRLYDPGRLTRWMRRFIRIWQRV